MYTFKSFLEKFKDRLESFNIKNKKDIIYYKCNFFPNEEEISFLEIFDLSNKKLTRYLGKYGDELIDINKNDFEFHPNLYSNICYDIISLKNRETYLRIFGKQDTPD